jgi:hypothetical protein
LNQRHAGALGPDRELVRRGGAKRIGGANQHVVAFGFDTLREFADGGRFADAVHTDDHHDVRRDGLGHARL